MMETVNLTESPIYNLLTHLQKSTGYKIKKDNTTISINTTIFVKPEITEEPKMSLEQLIEDTFLQADNKHFLHHATFDLLSYLDYHRIDPLLLCCS